MASKKDTKVGRFVMIASPRTGSTYLGRQLNHHPEIRFHGESFKPRRVPIYQREVGGDERKDLRAELLQIRERDPFEFLERLYALTDGRPRVGFKMAPAHEPAVLARLMTDSSVRKIVHMRMNSLARWASRRAARTAGSFAQSAEKPKVEFIANLFVEDHNAYMGFYGSAVRQLADAGQPFIVTRYDEINNPAMIAALYKFLGTKKAPPAEPPAETGARAPSNIVARFSNPDVVERFMRERDLMHWAYEGDTLFHELADYDVNQLA